MENKHVLNRLIRSTQVLSGIMMAGAATFWIIKTFLPRVHLVALKLLAFPFLIIGVKMHPANIQGRVAFLANAIVYIAIYSVIYVYFGKKRKKSCGIYESRRRIIFKSITSNTLWFAIIYLIQIAIIVLFIFSGFVQIVGIPLWILLLLEDDSKKAMGAAFLFLAVTYNTIILMVLYFTGRHSLYVKQEE